MMSEFNQDCKKAMREGNRDLTQLQSDLQKTQFKITQQNIYFNKEMTEEIGELSKSVYKQRQEQTNQHNFYERQIQGEIREVRKLAQECSDVDC